MRALLRHATDAYRAHPWFGGLMVLVFSFAAYFALGSNAVFPDPDGFYHLKMAELIASDGPIRSFVYLPFTTLAHAYADHHFLYHVALIPFIKVFGSFAGMRVATALFAALAVFSFRFLLRTLEVRYATSAALILAATSPFVFRANLPKAGAVAIALLLFGIAVILKKKPVATAIIAFAYVWTHAGWPALLVVGGILILCEWKNKLKMCIALYGGVLVGLILNPFFPQNLRFYWEQIIQIAVVNYQSTIGVGGEWYAYGAWRLFEDLPLFMFLGLLTVVALFFLHRTHKSKRTTFGLGVITLLFLVATLRSRRYVEYLVPVGFVLFFYVLDGVVPMVVERIRAWRKMVPVAFAFASIGILVSLGAFMVQGLRSAGTDLRSGYSFTRFKDAATFLKTHATPGEVIVHADWDDFPSLFYWDDEQRYIMGLDPTFMYRENEARYWEYVDFTLGKSTNPLAVLQGLGARYVVLDHEHGGLKRMLETSGKFRVAYADEESFIYERK